MKGFGTKEGTSRYGARFAGRAAEGHFRESLGLHMSSIGIGTYLGEPDARTDQSYAEAIVAAVHSGVNVIDSAINYRFQRSERSIGAALKELAASGYARDELVVCTKGGFLTPDGEMPLDPRTYFLREYFERGVMRPQEVAGGMHCMAPGFLADQLRRSLANLNVECIDVYYLHNPESQLASVSDEVFRARMRAAFEFLESAVAAGSIRCYGLATWSGFRQPDSALDYLSLEEMVNLAKEVSGKDHHLRCVQLPLNLGMPEALVMPNQSLQGHRLPMCRAAQELGIALIASASLLQRHVAHELPAYIGEVLGLDSDLHRALQFARSAPGITTALVGMSRAEHVRENLRLAEIAPTPLEQFLKLFGR